MSKLPGSAALRGSLVCIAQQYGEQIFGCDAIVIDCGLPKERL